MTNLEFSQPLVSSRSAAFTRLASRVLEALNEAVQYRRDEGETATQIADRLSWHRSAVTRALNGTSANLTLRTISDILWSCRFEPKDFKADPVEHISPNWVSSDREEVFFVYNIPTKELHLRDLEQPRSSASIVTHHQISISA